MLETPDQIEITETNLEMAKEIMGDAQFLGPDQIGLTFGIRLTPDSIPKVPYSENELIEAKKKGEILILRIDTLGDRPMTIRNLVAFRKNQGKELLNSVDFKDDDFTKDDFWAKDTDFLSKDTPKIEWKLINTSKIEGTEHLSFRAQKALTDQDPASLEYERDDTVTYWKAIWGQDFQKEPDQGKTVKIALDNLPRIDALLQKFNDIPKGSSLPTAVEAIYDQLIYYRTTGKSLITGRSAATLSVIPPIPGLDDNSRPIDISFDAQGNVLLHMRRSDRMGRPNALGKLETGTPVSYIQH